MCQFFSDPFDLFAAQDAPAALHDGAEILLVESKRRQGTLYFAQVGLFGGLVRTLVGSFSDVDKIPPGDRTRVLLAEVRQHLVDVLPEDGVDREQVDLLGPQVIALLIEKVRDPLQQDGGLAASRDSADHEHGHVLTADHGVLLLLDRRGDRLHLVRAAAGQRLQKHRILDRHLRVKEREQPVLFQVVLPAQLQVHVHAVPVHHVERLAVLLVVVGLRDRRAPVDHQLLPRVLRDPRAPDVVVLRFLFRVEQEPDSGKIGRLQQSLHAPEFLHRGVLLDIVLVDRVAHRLELYICLHRIRIAVKIQRQVAPDILFLFGGFLRDRLYLRFQRVAHFAELPVRLRQVRLFFFEDLLL